MNKEIWEGFAGKRVLLLQGPVGPFFRKFAAMLRTAGALDVRKVNFNGGDWLFYPTQAFNYRGTIQDWPSTLRRLADEWQIDCIFLFGDCRPIHGCAHRLAAEKGLDVWVFEEGYVRPNYVTLEKFGVNNNSKLPRDAAFYAALPEIPAIPEEKEVGNAFRYAAVWAFLYYLAAVLLQVFFRHYQHHRPLSVSEVPPWLVSPLRKIVYRYKERHIQERLSGELSKKFFLVPLQVNTDFQVRVHSDFDSVTHFIESVVKSFAEHAAPDGHLVIKHHPMDRGYHDYTSLVAQLARRWQLGARLMYIHDQHLPTLLQHARGVVLINSTVGLSALHHGTPLAAVGEALYKLDGLTHQGSLDSFWQVPEQSQPDMALYQRFRNHLVRTTQINGNFYRHGLFDSRVAASSVTAPALAQPRT